MQLFEYYLCTQSSLLLCAVIITTLFKGRELKLPEHWIKTLTAKILPSFLPPFLIRHAIILPGEFLLGSARKQE